MKSTTRQFLKDTGATTPVICGPMYPGSNPELIAAVSEAGGFGVVQPVALTSLYGHSFFNRLLTHHIVYRNMFTNIS